MKTLEDSERRNILRDGDESVRDTVRLDQDEKGTVGGTIRYEDMSVRDTMMREEGTS